MDNEFFMSAGFPPPTLYVANSSAISSRQALSSGMEIQTSQLNSTVEQFSESVFNPSWENSTDQNVHFDSALSSMLLSPAASNSNISDENFVIRELIGKLGNIGNFGEISRHSFQPFFGCHPAYISINNSANNSCYSTPLSSPPKVNLLMMDHLVKEKFPKFPNSKPLNPTLAEFSADPGFAERTAKFSCFGGSSLKGRTSQFGMNNAELPYRSNSLMESDELSRILSSPLIKTLGSEMSILEKKSPNSPLQSRTELGSSRENSTVSEQKPIRELNSLNGDSNFRKRKSISTEKAEEQTVSASSTPASKVAEANNDLAAKRCKPNKIEKQDNAIVKADEERKESSRTAGDQKQTKANQKPPEPPKDYIHVRARRGQATDSHSLAERVRREKISERMKLLQDLVPGCNKVTGKAPMLDEIINYVQSLQEQVEFLSMKLDSLNTRPNPNVKNTLVTENTYQPNNSMPHLIFPIDSSTSAFYGPHSQQNPALSSNISSGTLTQSTMDPLDSSLCQNLGMQLPSLSRFNKIVPQFPTFCEDDLQTIVQMGFSKDAVQETSLQSQSFEGSNKMDQARLSFNRCQKDQKNK